MEKSRGFALKKRWKLALFLLIGILVRVLPVWQSDYPLGEGGLFYCVIQYIAKNDRLPSEIPYYSCGIPFAYPPLGFIIYALLLRWKVLPLFTLLKWAPVFLSIVSLGAFVLLAREFLQGLAWEIAVLSFATMPSVSLRVTASDGIRNLAFLFNLLGLFTLHRALMHRNNKAWAFSTGILFGLTVLTHPVTAFGFLTVALLMVLYYSIIRKAQRPIFVAGISLATAALVILPWLLTLYRHYGFAFITMMKNAVLSRPHKSIWFFTLLEFGGTGEPFGQVWAVSGIVGALYSLTAGNPLLTLWLLVTPTHWFRPIYGTPLAMCAGLGIGEVVAPRLRLKTKLPKIWSDALLLCFLTAYVTGSALVFSVTPDVPFLGRLFGAKGMQSQVTEARLEAWNWMANHLDPSSRVVIVGEEKEWVPCFAHICANISQGAEWIGEFLNYGQMYNEIMGVSDYAGLAEVLKRYGQSVDYLYVSVKPSPRFLESMARNGGVLHTLLRDMDDLECAVKMFKNKEVVLYDLRECEKP